MKTFVRTIIMLAVLAIAGTAHAVPATIELSGRLTTAAGAPVAGDVVLTFTLYSEASGGAPVWSEIRPDLTASSDGLVFAALGATTPFDDAAFDGGDRWLEIKVGGETLAPRLKTHSVPYALRAGDADTVGGLAPEDLGDITAVNAGPGLTGGAASDAATLAVDSTYVQRRVTGSCANTGIATVKLDGGVTCAAAPPAPANPLASCTWHKAATASDSIIEAACPTGKHAISGGCDPIGTATVRFTRPFGPPADGALASTVSKWRCEFSASNTGHVAYALCCDF